MAKKQSHIAFYIIIIALVVITLLLLAANFSRITNIFNSQQVNTELPLNLDILGKLKLSYSDKWSINNKGTEGIELNKGDVTILLTTSKITNGKSLDEIVDSRNEELKSSKKIISDTKVIINNITFRREELGSLDETFFPSDGFISYSAVVNSDIYLTLIINFPSGGNPSEAESLVNTIRYN